jgi:hypothetical protein
MYIYMYLNTVIWKTSQKMMIDVDASELDSFVWAEGAEENLFKGYVFVCAYDLYIHMIIHTCLHRHVYRNICVYVYVCMSWIASYGLKALKKTYLKGMYLYLYVYVNACVYVYVSVYRYTCT